MDDVRIERILRAVECVPRGELATYGDIGKIVGESPRVIGRVMASGALMCLGGESVTAKERSQGTSTKRSPTGKKKTLRATTHAPVLN